MTTRRRLIGSLAAVAGLAAARPVCSATRPMKLLVLGGTLFLGPAIVQRALDRGHEVTLFNRGQTNPGLFPGIERIRGDRDPKSQDLAGLQGSRTWDAVIDVWPSDPAMCAETGRLLRDRVGRYVYVSTIVAYKDLTKVGLVETAPLFDDAGDKQAWYEFGKASCERTLMEIYRDRYACVRPPVIAGWRQDSDTLRFWMSRIARGGPVLAPGDGDDPVQFTDAHDVGAVALSLAEQGLSGAYNFAGPRRTRSTMKSVLEAFNAATGDRAELIWVRDDFLLKQDIQAWTNLPLYRPLHRAVRKGFMQIDSSKALAAGFDFRPIAATVEDELRWFRETTPADYEFGVGKSNKGFPRARELAVLAAWRGQGPA